MDPTSGTGGSPSGAALNGGSKATNNSTQPSARAAGSHSVATAQPQSAPIPTISRAEQKKAKAVSDAIDKSLRADKDRLQKERGAKLLIL
ncbi:hypothetical protein BGZ58_003833, partial [Dissophora ornata]